MDWYVKVLKKFAEFSGRAQRAEYWFFVLFNSIIALALMGGAMAAGGQESSMGGILMMVYNIYNLAVLVPSLAVSVRRLHDTNRSGWWLLIALIPCVGAIILIVFFVQDSDPGPNRFGPNPKMGIATR
jgi:uncharacterized membrane protein YhaH (DUF805 family)